MRPRGSVCTLDGRPGHEPNRGQRAQTPAVRGGRDRHGADCGIIGNPGAFNTALTGLIRDLLETVITNPDAFTTGELVELLSIGLRVGAVGQGAADQATSDKIIGNFKNIFSDRIDAAVAVGDEAELQLLVLAATMFGWDDLVNKATK